MFGFHDSNEDERSRTQTDKKRRRVVMIGAVVGFEVFTNLLSDAVLPSMKVAAATLTASLPRMVATTAALFLVLLAACLVHMHVALNSYFRTGSLRQFIAAALIGYCVLGSFYLVNNHLLPGTGCLPRTLVGALFFGMLVGAGLTFGVLSYELERVARHERRL